MSIVRVKNLVIGEGIPKVCIPVTGKTECEIIEEVKEVIKQEPDLVEWRVDCFKDGKEIGKVCKLLKTINDILGNIPLLFTFRTREEGGKAEISWQDYVKLLTEAAKTGEIELIDVEIFFKTEAAGGLIEELKELSVVVVASNHHFTETPETEQMQEIFTIMKECGADILKLAVMPKDKQDVLRLLSATVWAQEQMERPIITMSMGRLGVLSRICGEFSGSCVTFGAGLSASAPGQIPAVELKEILKSIHPFR